MIFTNRYNLPKAVADVLSKDGYKAGNSDYSATSLLKSPRQLQLAKRNHENISEDVSDRVWSLLGQAAHHVLEQHAEDEALVEERLYVDVLGRKLSGQVDNYHAGIITDYKVTSVWTLIRGSKVKDWEAQLNVYSYLFQKNGYEVKQLQIVTILRDWSEMEKLRTPGYPESPITVIPITLWGMAEAEAFVYERMVHHVNAEKLPSVGLPDCTPIERWQTSDVYAVMKEGRKSAVKLYDTEDAAIEHVLDSKDKLSIVKRPGTSRMCERYCPCRDFCSQWEGLKPDDN